PYSSSRSQNISVINGKVSASINFRYVLVPSAVGTYMIEPAEIEIGGEVYQTQPIQIEVISSSHVPPTAPQAAPPSVMAPSPPVAEEEEEEKRPYPKERLFIETHVDKLRAYTNEQITLTFGFYQAINLYENPLYSPPSTTGFWSEDMPPQRKYYKRINGIQYLVTEINTALFATSPGVYTIGPARLECKAEDLDAFFKRNPYSIFDEDPFSVFKTGKPVILKADPIKIEIAALPDESKPPDFKGDVGRFDISATLDKNKVEEDEAVTLRIKVTGDGNIKTISEPKVDVAADDFKVYDSGSSENISKENYRVHGEKIFEKVFLPRKAGKVTIPAISFSFFDPRSRAYKTVNTLPLELSVSASSQKKPARRLSRLKEKEAVKVVGEDIRFIKTPAAPLRDEGAPIYKNLFFIAINAFPLILLPLSILYRRHADRLKADTRYARAMYAHPFAQKRLKHARELTKQNKPKEFCAEIHHALTKYLADKLNISIGLTTDEMIDALRSRGTSQKIVDKLSALIAKSEQARFAPSGGAIAAPEEVSPSEMSSMLKTAEELIVELNRQLK
ncbi:MAG: protein BatD, partial [Candidatus Omnitrophica bacterium]|nr:protein BatD [Candidatus Omnitrophota bacterium]